MAGDMRADEDGEIFEEKDLERSATKLYVATLLIMLLAAAGLAAVGFYLLPVLLPTVLLSAALMGAVGLLLGLEIGLIIASLRREIKESAFFSDQTWRSYAIIILGAGLGVMAGLLFGIAFPVLLAVFAFAGPIGGFAILGALGLTAGLASISAVFLAADLLDSEEHFAKLALVQPFKGISRLAGLNSLKAAEKEESAELRGSFSRKLLEGEELMEEKEKEVVELKAGPGADNAALTVNATTSDRELSSSAESQNSLARQEIDEEKERADFSEDGFEFVSSKELAKLSNSSSAASQTTDLFQASAAAKEKAQQKQEEKPLSPKKPIENSMEDVSNEDLQGLFTSSQAQQFSQPPTHSLRQAQPVVVNLSSQESKIIEGIINRFLSDLEGMKLEAAISAQNVTPAMLEKIKTGITERLEKQLTDKSPSKSVKEKVNEAMNKEENRGSNMPHLLSGLSIIERHIEHQEAQSKAPATSIPSDGVPASSNKSSAS